MKTTFKDLDNIVKLTKGELIVIASRPGMGKSTFVQNILSNMAIKENKAVLFFSLEESSESIENKLSIINSMGEVDKFKLYEQYQKQVYILSNAPYTIDDICNNSHELKKDIDLIIIDYLQLIQFDKKKLLSRDNEIKEILKKLKMLAKELDVPIIITSQLSRKMESREDKKPYVSDFSDSESGILTYCDKVLFLYRDSYYNKNSSSNITDVIVAKNNDGNVDTIKLEWMSEYCKLGNAII